MENQEKPHILLIDGMALLFRSFFATSAMGHYFPNAGRYSDKCGPRVCAPYDDCDVDIQAVPYGSLLGYGCAYVPQ